MSDLDRDRLDRLASHLPTQSLASTLSYEDVATIRALVESAIEAHEAAKGEGDVDPSKPQPWDEGERGGYNMPDAPGPVEVSAAVAWDQGADFRTRHASMSAEYVRDANPYRGDALRAAGLPVAEDES